MQHSPQEIKTGLDRAVDPEGNVLDMAAVLEIVSTLERLPITKEALEATRIGKTINLLRKKTSNDDLAKRAKKLVKKWQKLVINHIEASRNVDSPLNGSRISSPQINGAIHDVEKAGTPTLCDRTEKPRILEGKKRGVKRRRNGSSSDNSPVMCATSSSQESGRSDTPKSMSGSISTPLSRTDSSSSLQLDVTSSSNGNKLVQDSSQDSNIGNVDSNTNSVTTTQSKVVKELSKPDVLEGTSKTDADNNLCGTSDNHIGKDNSSIDKASLGNNRTSNHVSVNNTSDNESNISVNKSLVHAINADIQQESSINKADKIHREKNIIENTTCDNQTGKPNIEKTKKCDSKAADVVESEDDVLQPSKRARRAESPIMCQKSESIKHSEVRVIGHDSVETRLETDDTSNTKNMSETMSEKPDSGNNVQIIQETLEDIPEQTEEPTLEPKEPELDLSAKADGINGRYSDDGTWYNWTEVMPYNEGTLNILPYVLLE